MPRRRWATACAVSTLIGLGSLTSAFGSTGGSDASATRQAARVDRPSSVLLVSDSAWLGIRLYGAADAVRGMTHTLDLASCRRRVVRSCTNYDGFVPITLLEELHLRGRRHTTLIVATGYNDSDRDFAGEVDTIMRTAESYGYDRVVWLTLRTNGVTYQSPDASGFQAVFLNNNSTLREIAGSGAYPELVVGDWAAYAESHPEWFAPDGIHLRRAGPFAAADYVSRKMAFLEQRACPVPATSGGPIADPCPDPDLSPAADVDRLYPVGRPIPATPFALEWEGSSSWPDAPWWER